MDNNKTYLLQAKRGYTFEDKKIVIDSKTLKYFNPSKINLTLLIYTYV